MTDAVPAIAVLAVPLGSAALVGLMPTPRAADRLNLATSGLTAALALALAVVGARRRAGRCRAGQLVRPRRGQRRLPRARRRRRLRQRRRLAVLPAPRRPQLVQRAALPRLVLRGLQRLLGGAARPAACRQPRPGLAADRGDHRRLGAAGRLQRQAQRARGGLEVRRAHHAGARHRPAGDRRALRRSRRRGRLRPRPPRLAGARPARGWASAGGDARRVRADHGRAGEQDRLGAGPQLAARRAQRGAAAGQRDALGGAAPDRAADRLADQARARAGARRRARSRSSSSASGSSPC